MSSFHSTGDAQRVPAWKRLGLKLKPASEAQGNDVTHPPTGTATTATSAAISSVPNGRAHLGSPTPTAKRRASGGAPALDHSAKRARQDSWQDHDSHQTPKKAKSVSFTADTAEPQPPAAAKPKKQKQTPTKGVVHAGPPKPLRKSAPVNLEPALAYLRTWHTSRDNWKFNKNHQTKLLEQVFADADETTIPAADINVFYEYIRGLQGGVRTRLRELANGVKAQDMEKGASAFAAPGSKTEMAERKQREYEEVINMFLSQTRTPEKRRFDETEYVLRTTDMEMQRRVVKRMRAEMVLDELSETDASELTTTTTTTTTSGESTSTEKASRLGDRSGQGPDDANARLKLNDGPQQRTKRKRKLRTAAVEDDTSSESESENESDDDTSSSGSSGGSSSTSDSGSDDDDDEGGAGTRADEDASSSSSSSSSSESESDSESDD
ncbi:hypothetical protein F5Y14DRAFT_80319 [Nemania sp. NC0429]|nr:hypothetical protein F5Y14DRAFT_80319 [Nemania sp. NC0429]